MNCAPHQEATLYHSMQKPTPLWTLLCEQKCAWAESRDGLWENGKEERAGVGL